MIEDPAAALDEYLAHRMAREAAIAHVLAGAGPEGLSVEAVVAVVYAEVPDAFHPIARYSVWAHLRKLGAGGRATSSDPDDLEAPWLPVTAAGF